MLYMSLIIWLLVVRESNILVTCVNLIFWLHIVKPLSSSILLFLDVTLDDC